MVIISNIMKRCTIARKSYKQYVKKAHYFLQRKGLKKTCRRAVNELYEMVRGTGDYMKWRKLHMPARAELARQRQDQEGKLLFYIITPYQDTVHLAQAALSIRKQTYCRWKWVIVCTKEEKSKAVGRLRLHIPRRQILFVHASDSQDSYSNRIALGIQAAEKDIQNTQTAKARTENACFKKNWLLLFDTADLLEPDALYRCMAAIRKDTAARMCYTDEDQISEDGMLYKEPLFKPDFNLDMLRARNYLGRMVLLRMDLVRQIAGWNSTFGADAAYDYYLRAAEACMESGAPVFESILHVPYAAYHAREGSRQDCPGICTKILNGHFKRQNIPAKAVPSQTPGIYRTVYQWEREPMVSVLIPNKDHVDDCRACVQSVLEKCSYQNYEIIIIENNSTQKDTFDYYKEIQKDGRVRVIYWKSGYNFAKIINFGARYALGEYLLLLNNDTEVISPDFMEEMLGYCMRQDVGVCGVRLLYFDDTVQHAGIIIGLDDSCGECFQRFPKESGGYADRIFCPQDMSAVTGACLMTKKSVFMEIGGMDEKLQIAYNDIDYCLKVQRSGKLVVYNPFAQLYHYEYKSRGAEDTAEKLARYKREADLFTTRWAHIIREGDPYYNPNLTRRYPDFSLRRAELWKSKG